MQKLVRNFSHENFCMRSNYSNTSRAVIHVNHMKIFLHGNFLHENKGNYGKEIYIALCLIALHTCPQSLHYVLNESVYFFLHNLQP